MHADFRRYEGTFAVNSVPRQPAFHASAGTDNLAAHLPRIHIFGQHFQFKVRL